MLKENKKFFSFVLFALGVVVLFAFAYRKLLGCGMIGYSDASPFPPDAKTAFQAFISTWQPLSHGTTAPSAMITLYQALVLFIFGNNVVLAAKVFHFSALPLGCITMYLFLSRFIRCEPAKIIASLIYVINPPTIGNFLGGSIGILYAHAFFPLVMIFLFNIRSNSLEGRSQLNDALFFCLFLVLAYSFSTHILIFIFPAIALVSINVLVRKGFWSSLKVSLVFGFALILCFLLTLPFAFYLFGIVRKFVPGAGNLVAGQSLKDLLWTVQYCFGKSFIMNILRIGAEHLWFLGYEEGGYRNAAGFILPLLAFSALLLFSGKRQRRYVVGFSILAVGLILFIWTTKVGPGLYLFRKFPFLFNFRNPSRPTMLLAFAYTPLIAITISEIHQRLALFKFKKRNTAIFYSVILLALSLYMWPFFTGDMAFPKAGRQRIDIPEVFEKAGKWLSTQRTKEGFFRTYWVPLDFEPTEVSLRWIDTDRLGFPLGGELYGLRGQNYALFLAEAICNADTKHMGLLFGLFNVKYALINLTSSQEDSCRIENDYIQGDPNNFVEILDRQTDMELILNEKEFKVYKNKEFIPHLAIYENILFFPQTKASLFEQIKEVSLFSNFHNGYWLPIFEEQLLEDKKEFILNNSSTVIFSPKYLSSPGKVTGALEPDFYKINATEYRLDINTSKPLFIFLGEMFHPSWSAFCNGKKLKHFPAFFGNVFYLDSIGQNTVKIIFEEQKLKNLTSIIAGFTWIFVFIGLIFTSIMKRIERRL